MLMQRNHLPNPGTTHFLTLITRAGEIIQTLDGDNKLLAK
jgi:hypothetical protein